MDKLLVIKDNLSDFVKENFSKASHFKIEVHGVEVPKWVLATAAGGVGLYVYNKVFFNDFHKQGIPMVGRTLPLLGNFMQSLFIGYKEEEELLSKHGKVLGWYFSHIPALTVADPEMVKQITVKQFDKFTNHVDSFIHQKPADEMLIFLQNEKWRQVRHLVSPVFSGGKLKLMTPHMNNASRQLVEQIGVLSQKGEALEMKKICGRLAMDVIAGTAFGIQVNTQVNPNDLFLKHGEALANFDGVKMLIAWMFPFLGVKSFPESSINFFSDIVQQAINARKEQDQGPKDFLQLLVNAEKDKDLAEDNSVNMAMPKTGRRKEALTKDEILGQALIFFLAGYETVSSTMSFLCYNLATNQNCQNRIRDEVEGIMGDRETIEYEDVNKMEYMEQCLSETLRMFPSLPYQLDRQCTEDTEVEGYKIYKGWLIMINPYRLHHDPEVYPDPYTFNPDRFTPEAKASRHPYSYMPFGLGPRACVGMRLAIMEIKMATAALIQKYKLMPSEKTEVPIKLERLLMKATNGVWLKAQPV